MNNSVDLKQGLLLMGDSIAAGLGVSDDKYGRILSKELDVSLVDISASARPISESERLLPSDLRGIGVVIIAHGITEAILRPSERSLAFVPMRWRRAGWLDPRPYYSTRLLRRFGQRVESSVRWRVKRLLLSRCSPGQMMDLPAYTATLRRIKVKMRAAGVRIIVLGPPELDERFFPGSPAQLALYAKAAEDEGVEYVSLTGVLHKWDDYFADHFHPNGRGHRKIADVILHALLTTPPMHHA